MTFVGDIEEMGKYPLLLCNKVENQAQGLNRKGTQSPVITIIYFTFFAITAFDYNTISLTLRTSTQFLRYVLFVNKWLPVTSSVW